jgi:plastocyanin
MTRVGRFVVVVAFVGAIVGSGAASASAVTVRGDGSQWRPGTVGISPGGSVRWSAVFRTHVVKAYGSNWTYRRRIAEGESTPLRTFNAGGTYRFYCTIHGSVVAGRCTGMCGKVVV